MGTIGIVSELLHTPRLTEEERKFVHDVKSGKVKLDFLQHSGLWKSINKKIEPFEKMKNINEVVNYIHSEIVNLDSEIYNLKKMRSKYEYIMEEIERHQKTNF